jgi:hypothetical protein
LQHLLETEMVIPQAAHATQAPVLPPANTPADGKRKSGFRPPLASGRRRSWPEGSGRSAAAGLPEAWHDIFLTAPPVDGEI